MRAATEFKDYLHWVKLHEKHLGSYTAPKPEAPCTLESMNFWLERLGMEKSYQKIHGTLEDFIRLNPGWPLFAWLGTCLEDIEGS